MSHRNSEAQKKPQKRRAYSEKNVRISRTGGVAVTKTFKKDGVGATLNTKQGLRLHKRFLSRLLMPWFWLQIVRFVSYLFNYEVSITN